jgi:hypothetical protein
MPTEDYEGVKITYGFISELLKISFFTEYGHVSENSPLPSPPPEGQGWVEG